MPSPQPLALVVGQATNFCFSLEHETANMSSRVCERDKGMCTLPLLKSKNNRENGRLSLFMAAGAISAATLLWKTILARKKTAYYSSLFSVRLANFLILLAKSFGALRLYRFILPSHESAPVTYVIAYI